MRCMRDFAPVEFHRIMAYMSQERKAQLSPAIKAHCAKYGVKASIGVNHSSTLVVNIKSGKLDLCVNSFEACHEQYSRKYPHSTPQTLADYKAIQVNPYWCHEHFTGKCQEFIVELVRLMNIGNHDRSDIQSDYFDVGWYVSINIGKWNTPYVVTK